MEGFFEELFKPVTIFSVVAGAIVSVIVNLKGRILLTLKQRQDAASRSVADAFTADGVPLKILFYTLLVLVLAAVWILYLFMTTGFLQSGATLIVTGSILNLLLLGALAFFASPAGNGSAVAKKYNRPLVLANSIVVMLVLCILIRKIFSQFIFSDKFWLPAPDYFFATWQSFLLIIFYAANFLLLFRKSLIGGWLSQARTVGIIVLALFTAGIWYMPVTTPITEDSSIIKENKDNEGTLKEIREMQALQ